MTSSVETLLEALPYIREFHGRTIVIKYGGAAMRDEELREAFARDVVLLKYVGMNPVIVHGGGPEITHYMERMGMEVKFVEGLRVSDAETVEVAKMVLLGKINSDILVRLNRHGQPAVGLGGEDGSLFEVRPVANTKDVGFVGEIEKVNVDVIDHIAEDYVPVIASVATDRDGASYNVNADEAAGKVAAAMPAHKAIFLTDVDGWLRDPEDPESRISTATADEVRAGAGRHRGRHATEARGLRRGDRGRGGGGPHRRWPPSAHAAARALHRRRHRHQDHRMKLAELQELEARWVMQTYARMPVEFVRGEGARLWDSDGKEYLDFLAGISVCSVGHCHPAVVEAVREQVGTLTHTSNLYLTEGGVLLAQRLASSSLDGRAFLCNSGTEANECAIKLVRKHAHGRGIAEPEIVVLEGAFHGRTMGSLSATPGLATNDSFSPYLPGFRTVPRDDPDALEAVVGESTAAVMLEPIQGETGVQRDPGRGDRRGAGGLRHGRGAAGLRRDPDRDGPHGVALGIRAAPGPPRRDDDREGARRRTAGRRLRRRSSGGRAGAGRPRLDLRRRASGRGRRPRRLRRDRRPRAAAERPRPRREVPRGARRDRCDR